MRRALMLCGLIVLAAAGFCQARTAIHPAKASAIATRHGAAHRHAAHKAKHGHKYTRAGLRTHHATVKHHRVRAHSAAHSARAA